MLRHSKHWRAMAMPHTLRVRQHDTHFLRILFHFVQICTGLENGRTVITKVFFVYNYGNRHLFASSDKKL